MKKNKNLNLKMIIKKIEKIKIIINKKILIKIKATQLIIELLSFKN